MNGGAILILDDDPIFCRLAIAMAARLELRVVCWPEWPRTPPLEHFAVAVLDQHLEGRMPQLGSRLASEMPTVPVLLMSADGTVPEHPEPWPSNVKRFLDKRVGIERILLCAANVASTSAKPPGGKLKTLWDRFVG